MAIFGRLRSHFLDRPVPDAVIGIASGFVGGLRTGRRRGSIRERFVLPLSPGILAPSFDRKNLTDAEALTSQLRQGLAVLGLEGGTVSLLVPESSVRVFVLAADELPASRAERDAFVRWRTGKQMPLLHDDIRMDYAVSSGPAMKKIVISMARSAVVGEYEDVFRGLGLEVGMVTIPSLSLVRLVAAAGDGANGVILNVEDDHLSLLALRNGEGSLYRQKIIAASGEAADGLREVVEQVVQEVENTAHFLEDKEGQAVGKVWVRSGLLKDGQEIAAALAKTGTLTVEELDFPDGGRFDARERALLAPLAGQIR